MYGTFPWLLTLHFYHDPVVLINYTNVGHSRKKDKNMIQSPQTTTAVKLSSKYQQFLNCIIKKLVVVNQNSLFALGLLALQLVPTFAQIIYFK